MPGKDRSASRAQLVDGGSHPLRNIHSLQGGKVFFSLDPCGAYHAVRIETGSRACTVFISPFGTFQYIQMPFGLANAGTVYNRMLDIAMKEWIGTSGPHTWMISWLSVGSLGHTSDIWPRYSGHKWPLGSRYNPVRDHVVPVWGGVPVEHD